MILDEIVADTRLRLARRKALRPAETLRAEGAARPPALNLAAALSAPGVSVIAEIKRASPSRGALNPTLDPGALAAQYVGAGAAAVSVLTEEGRFHGSLDDLATARAGLAAAGLSAPLLRKDFIVDGYQLLEARAYGADAVLLIVAALDDETLATLLGEALALGLSPLVEVHDEAEMGRAASLHPPIIGINNRNLRDFRVDLAVSERLRPLAPAGCRVVAESGVHTPADVARLAALGVDGVLVGEALVTAPDPAARLRTLREAGA